MFCRLTQLDDRRRLQNTYPKKRLPRWGLQLKLSAPLFNNRYYKRNLSVYWVYNKLNHGFPPLSHS